MPSQTPVPGSTTVSPLIAVLLALLAIMLSADAHADLDTELQSVFQGMVNTTPGGAYQTQRRGVITGGNLAARTRILNPNVVSFVPPSFKAGCNGIDVFGGSFSYINAQQFTAVLRNIAQSAMGYAFQLAIEGMCPTCNQVMSKLQKDVQFINNLMSNSCHAAQQVFEATGIDDSIRKGNTWMKDQMPALELSDKGFISDIFDGFNSTKSPAEQAIAKGQAKKISANPLHEAIRTANVMDWFIHSAGDTATQKAQMEMVIAGLTGMVIVTTDDNASNGKDPPHPEQVVRTIQNTLDLRDIIDGGTLTIPKCNDDDCFEPTTQTITFQGMHDRVRHMLLGNGICASCSGGILRKLDATRTGGVGFTVDEQKFIEASVPGAQGLLDRLSHEPQAAALVGEKMVGILAIEMASQLVDAFIDAARLALGGTGKNLDSAMLSRIRDIKADIATERQKAKTQADAVGELLTIQSNVERMIQTSD